MRRRALLFVVLAGGLAGATGAAIGTGAVPWHDSPGTTALARADLADVATPGAASRARDHLGRDHDVRRDVAAALGIGLILTMSGGFWFARERAAHALHRRPRAIPRTRAPPLVPAIVHC